MLDCIFGATDKEQEKGLEPAPGSGCPPSSCRNPDFLLLNHHSSSSPTRPKHPVQEATGRAFSTSACHQLKGGSSPLGHHTVPSTNPQAALPLESAPLSYPL